MVGRGVVDAVGVAVGSVVCVASAVGNGDGVDVALVIIGKGVDCAQAVRNNIPPSIPITIRCMLFLPTSTPLILLFNVLHPIHVLEMFILCPKCGIIVAGSGKNNAIGKCQFEFARDFCGIQGKLAVEFNDLP